MAILPEGTHVGRSTSACSSRRAATVAFAGSLWFSQLKRSTLRGPLRSSNHREYHQAFGHSYELCQSLPNPSREDTPSGLFARHLLYQAAGLRWQLR